MMRHYFFGWLLLLSSLSACREELVPSNVVENGEARIAFLAPAPHSVHQGDTVWLRIEIVRPFIEFISLRILRDGMPYFETPEVQQRVAISDTLFIERPIPLRDNEHRHFEVSAMTWNSETDTTEALLFFHTKH